MPAYYPAYFGDELSLPGPVFAKHGLGFLSKKSRFFLRQRLCSHDKNREFFQGRLAPYMLNDLKTVHSRHQEIQQDSPDHLRREHFERSPPISHALSLISSRAEGFLHQFQGFRIIVYHQNCGIVIGRRGDVLANRLQKFRFAHGFDEIVGRAQREPYSLLIDDGKNDDRDMGCLWGLPESHQSFEAASTWHQDIQSDSVRP